MPNNNQPPNKQSIEQTIAEINERSVAAHERIDEMLSNLEQLGATFRQNEIELPNGIPSVIEVPNNNSNNVSVPPRPEIRRSKHKTSGLQATSIPMRSLPREKAFADEEAERRKSDIVDGPTR